MSMLQNELAILEFIHLLVETMDRHFGNVVSPHVRSKMISYELHFLFRSLSREIVSINNFLFIYCLLNDVFPMGFAELLTWFTTLLEQDLFYRLYICVIEF